jgi:PHD/YefM family antitoxin component YafN of YafNO toxin-antitoxin module
MTSREFNQDVAKAKRLADEGPLVITDRGKPAYVLLRHDAYERLSGTGQSILDLIADPASEHIEFEPQPLQGSRIRSTDLA